MSPSGRSEEITLLRRAIGGLEAGVAPADGALRLGAGDNPHLPRRALCGEGQSALLAPRLLLGLERDEQPFWLDAALGGGLKRGALYETAPGEAGDQTAACAFALGLAIRFARAHSGAVIWVVENVALHETGAPSGPGLAEWGLDPGRLILVRAADARATLWALEEALKCQTCAAVVGELWSSARRYGQAAARRLVLAARKGGASCILLHPERTGGAIDSHGAQARFAVFAAPDPQASGRPSATPRLPTQPRFAVQVLKTRLEGGRAALSDPQARRPIVWNAKKGLFDDPLSLDLAAMPCDRTRPAKSA